MNRTQTSFWKRPRGMVVLGTGGLVLLATAWIAFSRLGPSPSSQAFTPARRIDENALVAANAERPGETAAAPAAADANAVETASGDDAPGDAAVPPLGADKPADPASDAEGALEDVEAAIDEAAGEVEEALGGEEGGKPDR